MGLIGRIKRAIFGDTSGRGEDAALTEFERRSDALSPAFDALAGFADSGSDLPTLARDFGAYSQAFDAMRTGFDRLTVAFSAVPVATPLRPKALAVFMANANFARYHAERFARCAMALAEASTGELESMYSDAEVDGRLFALQVETAIQCATRDA